MESPRTLGQAVKGLRLKAGLSLRELAEKTKVTAPFLSDVELGRRFPSEEKLVELASALGVELAQLQKFDFRETAADVKKFLEQNPAYGFAFRTALNQAQDKGVSPEDLVKRIKK
jgi:transcriptional regulator with XRE-family HTH domain